MLSICYLGIGVSIRISSKFLKIRHARFFSKTSSKENNARAPLCFVRALYVLAKGPNCEDHEHVGVRSVLVLVAGRAIRPEQLMADVVTGSPLSFGCSSSAVVLARVLP